MWTLDWDLPADVEFADYLDAALQYGTTANGVYGMKIQWMHVATLAREVSFEGDSAGVLDQLFPGAQFVNIVRRDRRAQALSWFRANATNEWWRFKDHQPATSGTVAFDLPGVQALEIEIARQQDAWERYFRTRGISPLTVEYEALDGDYRGQISQVLSFLGLDSSAGRSIPPPRLARQSDDLTARWRSLMEAAVSHASV